MISRLIDQNRSAFFRKLIILLIVISFYLLGFFQIQFWPFIDHGVFHNYSNPSETKIFLLFASDLKKSDYLVSVKNKERSVIDPIKLNRFVTRDVLKNNRDKIKTYLESHINSLNRHDPRWILLKDMITLELRERYFPDFGEGYKRQEAIVLRFIIVHSKDNELRLEVDKNI